MHTMNLISRRNTQDDVTDDASQSSDDSYNKLGETLVRATKSLATRLQSHTKASERELDELNQTLDIDRYRTSVNTDDGAADVISVGNADALNDRYDGANATNLHQGLRSVMHTDQGVNPRLDDDDLSFDVSEEGEGKHAKFVSTIDEVDEGDSSAKGDGNIGGTASSKQGSDWMRFNSIRDYRGFDDDSHSNDSSGEKLSSGEKQLSSGSVLSGIDSVKSLISNYRSQRRSSSDDSEPGSSNTDHHVQSRARFVQRNMSNAAMNTTSFRNLKMLMKEKGVVTGNALAHILQEVAEEHAVNETPSEFADNHNGIQGNGFRDSEGPLSKEDVSFLPSRSQSLPLPLNGNASHAWSFEKRRSVPDLDGDNVSPPPHSRVLGRTGSKVEELLAQAAKSMQERIEKDPMFGGETSNAHRPQPQHPYTALPSRESMTEHLTDILGQAADEGKSCLVSIHGPKYVGKTTLVRKVIDTSQIHGAGYTVLSSSRSSNDALTSFFPFRNIVSMALRACYNATKRLDQSYIDYEAIHQAIDGNGDRCIEGCGGDDPGQSDEKAMQRLIERKILTKYDRLAIGRILPAVSNDELLSLLQGRNPKALTKDIAASLFKIIIPLQPVLFVFEANGDDCDIDPSSWDLIEELLLSARKQCPQMLLVAMSRCPLTSAIPPSIADSHVSIPMERMDVRDTEDYIRALFCDPPSCIDPNMSVDSEVVEGIFDRAAGCPLFTERIIRWSRMKEVVELDETRNAVTINSHQTYLSPVAASTLDFLLDSLPANLNEELLEVINSLPYDHLEALKLAACMGISFDLNDYESLRRNGFATLLQEVMASHGIFDEANGCYRWRHAAVFEAVESIIILNERVELHQRIADSLGDEAYRDHNINDGVNLDNSARYARHFFMSEQWEEAFDRCMEKGTKSQERLDFVGAVACFKQAKTCLTWFSQKPSLQRRLSPRVALGWCLRELLHYDEAEKELEFCLEEILAVPESERNAEFSEIQIDVQTTLATLKQAQSKYSEAAELFDRALPIARANKEKHSRVWLAHHVSSCAEIHRKSGDLEQAKILHTEALSYRERAVEENSCTNLELAVSFTQLGCTLSGLGDYASSYNLHKKSLAARVDHLDFSHSLVSESLNYCADALEKLGNGGEGIPLGMHAVKIRKHVFGPQHPAYAHALSVLASCLHSVGRSLDALELLKECLAICEKAFSKNHANMIPNLMLYGSVLRKTGKVDDARVVYERALSIHQLNFKGGKNAQQLVKLQDAMQVFSESPDTPAKTSIEMAIPPFEADNIMPHVVVCADIGQRPSDEYMLSVAASLQKMSVLKLVSVIAVSPPQLVRANISRGVLDSLRLFNVPVAYSGVVSTTSKAGNAPTFNADYGKPSAHVNNTGVELLTRVLLKAPEKSLVILGTACLGDISDTIDIHRDLFARKVKQVVVIGSVKPQKRRSFVEPDEYDGEKDMKYATNVYKACQDLGISMLTICKDISRGFPFSSQLVEDLAKTSHMIATTVQCAEEMNTNSTWEAMKQEANSNNHRSSPAIKSYVKYFLGGKHPHSSHHNIWPLIKSINLELVIGLLSCVPTYQSYFRWETQTIKGVDQKVLRHANAAAGIIKAESLATEIHMLIGFALRASLLSTSC